MSLEIKINIISEEEFFKYHSQINQIKGLILGAMANDKNTFYHLAFDSFEMLVVKPINEKMDNYNTMSRLMHK